MRKWYYVLILLLLCVAFIVCGTRSTRFPSAKLKAEIEEAWQKKTGYKLNLDDGCHGYYGTYDGAVVFFGYGATMAVWKINVAGVEFQWNHGANLKVYKEGEFYSLEEAYELGLLTEKNIKSISKYHERFKAEYRKQFKAKQRY